MSVTKQQSRTSKTVYRRFWRIKLVNKQGIHAQHDGWVVCMERTGKPGSGGNQSRVEIQQEWEAAIKKVEALGIDNGPDGEFAGYELQPQIVEWNGDVAELY